MRLEHSIPGDQLLIVDDAQLEDGAFVGEARLVTTPGETIYADCITLNDPRSCTNFVLRLMEERPDLAAASGEIGGALTAWGIDPQTTLGGTSPLPIRFDLASGATIDVSKAWYDDKSLLCCTLVKSFPNDPRLISGDVTFDNRGNERIWRDKLEYRQDAWVSFREAIRETAGDSANCANCANGVWDTPIPFGATARPPFPVASLPATFGAMVEAVATFTQTPPDLAAFIGLAVVAAAVRGRVAVKVKAGYTEPANVWTVVALGPANRKSAVVRALTTPIIAYEAHEGARIAFAVAEAASDRKIKEGALARLQQEAARATGNDQAKLGREARDLAVAIAGDRAPITPQLIVDDTTPEKLASLLAEQGGSIALLSAEGGIFDTISGRYSNGVPNLDVFLKGHAGDDLRVSRQGREPLFIAAPALTIGLAVQPEVLAGLADRPGFRGRGLLGRFFFALPESLIGRRDTDPPPIADSVTQDYAATIDALLLIDRRDEGPHELTFDATALPRLRAWECEVERELGEFGSLGQMADWGGKLFGATARIAALLHLSAHGGLAIHGPIEAATVEAAIIVARYLIEHAHAAFDSMGADPALGDARYLLRAIEKLGSETFSKRDLFEKTKRRFRKADALDPPLRLIIDHGFIRERASEVRSGPGRKPSPAYEVNPYWIASQNSHNSQNVSTT